MDLLTAMKLALAPPEKEQSVIEPDGEPFSWKISRRLAIALPMLAYLTGLAAAEPGRIVLQSAAIDIRSGSSAQWQFEVPAAPKGRVWALGLEVRAWDDSHLHAGSTGFFMRIVVNDHPAVAQKDRLHIYLRNRPVSYAVGPWYTRSAGWRVAALPTFEQRTKLGPEATSFVIDVGHLLRPGKNTLVIADNAAGGLSPTLIVRDVRLMLLPRRSEPAGLTVPDRGQPDLGMTLDGSLLVRSGKLRFPVRSAFSVPGGGWVRIGPSISRRADEAAGSMTRSRRGAMILRTPNYTVERSARVFKDKIVVRDKIINLSGADLGMMVRYELALPERVATARLAGDDEPVQVQKVAPYNPTVFIPLGGLSLALVAEDDVLRQQGMLSYDDAHARAGDKPHAGLRTERLTIPAGESVTLRWSLYALRGADYYDFVNHLRRDWGVHLRLDGPYWWNVLRSMPLSDEALASWHKKHPVYAAVVGSWVYPDDKGPMRAQALGAGVFDPSFEKYRDLVRRSIERIRRLMPGIRIGIYNHMFFNAPQAAPKQFEDSWIINAAGRPYVETFSGRYTPATGVYPTKTNSFGRDFTRTLDAESAAFGVDGFYFDETNHPGRLRDPITYGAWDRRSGILDPKTFAIRRKVGYIALLDASYQEMLYASLRSNGFWLLGNDQPSRLAGNRDGWPRFTETDVLSNAYRSHLYSPLAFSGHFERYTVRDLRDRLDLGTIYCVTGPNDKLGIVDKFFPITPTEIHSGWIMGEERIITDRSGTFGWIDHLSRTRVWRYDAQGKLVEANPSWHQTSGRMAIMVPAGGIVIIER